VTKNQTDTTFKVGDRVRTNKTVEPKNRGKLGTLKVGGLYGNLAVLLDGLSDTLLFSKSELELAPKLASSAETPTTPKATPQKGDKVRATLGESVIIGTVKDFSGNGGRYQLILPDAAPTHATMGLSLDEWSIEVIREPITLPTNWGAIVQVGNATYQLLHSAIWRSSYGVNVSASGLTTIAETSPYVVLFEGIDPSKDMSVV